MSWSDLEPWPKTGAGALVPPLPGLRLGHWQDRVAATGCTVLLPLAGEMRAGVHIGGGAPGTRETDLLAPTATVAAIHGLLLTGGSAFGLDAASGVMRYLREQGRGFATPVARVPLVPAAVLFDLDLGAADVWPEAAAGYAACEAAREDEAGEGTVGAGCGATVGRLLGPAARTKGGLGLAVAAPVAGVRVSALAVVNAAGDVVDARGAVLAGARGPKGFVDSRRLLRGCVAGLGPPPLTNTTLVVVVTDARLDKLALTRLAQQAHDGLALAVSPVHTSSDGDCVFALSTGDREANADALAVLAVECTAAAIRRAVSQATALHGVPAMRDLTREKR
jgi:L-aminopeptidase/D-esterase-like protein